MAKLSELKAVNLLIERNIPFAIYRLPATIQKKLIVQKDRTIHKIGFADLDHTEGFVVAPFDSYETKQIFLIKKDLFFDLKEFTGELFDFIVSNEKNEPAFAQNYVASKRDYFRSAEKLIEKLKTGKLEKVVLSRVIQEKLSANYNADLFFNLLCEIYPDAFVYLFNLPGYGLWTCATPEMLLIRTANQSETVSLAGTSLANRVEWTSKERHEQQLVTDFIEQVLAEEKINNYSVHGPETVFSGKLAHLKTKFILPSELVKGKAGRLVEKLHPTPAVCGLEKNKAYQLIKETEKHERRFYTGFLGPVNIFEETHLYVNLRCAELGKKEMNLYVGGGLTKDSNPDSEWEETLRKSKTLLSVADKIKTFNS